MLNKSSKVSVVVPVRDRADLLMRCIEVLKTQDFPADQYDIVICDDGSRQELCDPVSRFQPGPPAIRLLRQDCRGPAAARNFGIRQSIAPIVLFLDSDVLPGKGLIRRLVDALDQNPDWAGAEACLIPAGDLESPLWEAPDSPHGGRFHTAAIAYRRDALIAVGGLDEAFPLPACEDVELAARILKLGSIGFVPDAVAHHPRRRVGIQIHWRARLHWQYLVILAKRYGFLAFPDRKIGRCSRLRVAFSAVVTLPVGRFFQALQCAGRRPLDSIVAIFYALFDVLCGTWALPSILFCPVPERLNYLREERQDGGRP